jgi:hypothetical protein
VAAAANFVFCSDKFFFINAYVALDLAAYFFTEELTAAAVTDMWVR